MNEDTAVDEVRADHRVVTVLSADLFLDDLILGRNQGSAVCTFLHQSCGEGFHPFASAVHITVAAQGTHVSFTDQIDKLEILFLLLPDQFQFTNEDLELGDGADGDEDFFAVGFGKKRSDDA